MFTPSIQREDAAVLETESFLDRVYNGSLHMMLSAFTKKQNLSKAEIEELHAILDEMEANADD